MTTQATGRQDQPTLRRRAGFAAAVLAALLSASPLAAQTAGQTTGRSTDRSTGRSTGQSDAPAGSASLALTGRLDHPGALDLAAVQAQPPVTIEVTRASPQGPRTTRYTGALLWTLIANASPVHEAGPHSALRHTIFARGRDGYIVALAIGELDPEFEGKQVLVAYAEDDKPLAGLRLVVPGDKRAGRSVHDLVSIEVR